MDGNAVRRVELLALDADSADDPTSREHAHAVVGVVGHVDTIVGVDGHAARVEERSVLRGPVPMRWCAVAGNRRHLSSWCHETYSVVAAVCNEEHAGRIQRDAAGMSKGSLGA